MKFTGPFAPLAIANEIANQFRDQTGPGSTAQAQLADSFAASINTMTTNAMSVAAGKTKPVAPAKVKGFGNGLKPSDLFGPLIKQIPANLEEALLDAERTNDPNRIKAVLQRILSTMTEALDDPRLKTAGRIAIKTIINSVTSQIETQDQVIAAGIQDAQDARDRRTKALTDKAKAKADKQKNRFQILFDNLSGQISSADAAGNFEKERQKAVALQAAIRAQIKIEGRTADLVRKLADAQAAEAKAITRAAQARKDAAQARQFRALGLTETGDEPVPGIANLAKRINQTLKNANLGKIDISSKLVSRLKAARKLIKTEGGKLTEDTRRVINDFLKAATGQDDKTKTTGPLTKTSALNVNRILDGLGLSRDAEKELRSRLSGINSAGRMLSGKPAAATGGFVSAPFVVESHTTVTLDGDVVGRNVTRSQQKASRRNPPQRRGPNAR